MTPRSRNDSRDELRALDAEFAEKVLGWTVYSQGEILRHGGAYIIKETLALCHRQADTAPRCYKLGLVSVNL